MAAHVQGLTVSLLQSSLLLVLSLLSLALSGLSVQISTTASRNDQSFLVLEAYFPRLPLLLPRHKMVCHLIHDFSPPILQLQDHTTSSRFRECSANLYHLLTPFFHKYL